jgi:hypothetical protein
MPKEDRAIVNLPKSFKKEKLDPHPTQKIIETFEKVESQKDEINKLKEENTQLKKAQVENPKLSPTDAIQEGKHPCGFYCLDGNGKVDCLKFYDEKGVVRQVPQEVCDKHFTFMQGATQSKRELFKKDTIITEQLPCLCRFDQEDEWFCALNAPTVRKLDYGLKTCQACPKRLTEELRKKHEVAGKFSNTDRYVTCGAKITEDTKVGLLVWDSKDPTCPHQGQAYPLTHCFSVKCPNAKMVQYTVKR